MPFNQNINFNWSIAADSGVIQSSISYRIEISNDVSFTNILQASNISTSSFQQLFNSNKSCALLIVHPARTTISLSSIATFGLRVPLKFL